MFTDFLPPWQRKVDPGVVLSTDRKQLGDSAVVCVFAAVTDLPAIVCRDLG